MSLRTVANQPYTDAMTVLIAGPTASGKSALALKLARERDGIIINADSMQVYAELRIITARPSREDEAQAPHRLYGHIPAAVAYSVGRYVQDVSAEIELARARNQTAIIVGGTGLYFKVLLEGLSPIPEIPAGVRSHWREEANRHGAIALHGQLAVRDPVMAARLRPTDPQRIVRALEVIEATGRSLAEWQDVPSVPIIETARAERFVVAPPRETIVTRADQRFDAMIEAGALEEVERLVALQLDPTLPAMRALGVAPLAAHLAGKVSLPEAIEASKRETRAYVKRQFTWLRRHMMTWNWL